MKNFRLLPGLVALVILLSGVVAATSSRAVDVPIGNAGFEANEITPGAFVVLVPQGWVTYDPSGIINQGNNSVGVIRPTLGSEYFPAGAPQGSNAALVFLSGAQTAVAGLQQTLAASLQPNTRYRLSAQIGNIASGTSTAGSTGGAGIFYDLDGFPGYRLDLVAGGIVVAADTNWIGAAIAEGEFRLATLTFDTGTTNVQLGQTLGIRLVNLKAPGTPGVPNIEVDFDDVRLSAEPIPTRPTLGITPSTTQALITITGTIGASYRVEYAAAVPTTNWLPLTNVTLPASPYVVADNQPLMSLPIRFYRAVIPQ